MQRQQFSWTECSQQSSWTECSQRSSCRACWVAPRGCDDLRESVEWSSPINAQVEVEVPKKIKAPDSFFLNHRSLCLFR